MRQLQAIQEYMWIAGFYGAKKPKPGVIGPNDMKAFRSAMVYASNSGQDATTALSQAAGTAQQTGTAGGGTHIIPAAKVEEKLRRKGPVITTQEIGIEVLSQLRKLDDVAYLRFASVYKDFQELTDFERELGLLLQKRVARKAPPRRSPSRA